MQTTPPKGLSLATDLPVWQDRDVFSGDRAVFHVGDVVKKRRMRAGLTLQQLATKSTVNKGTISAIERGKANPQADTLGKIAGALDTTVESLFRSLETEVSSDAILEADAERQRRQIPEAADEDGQSIFDAHRTLLQHAHEIHGYLSKLVSSGAIRPATAWLALEILRSQLRPFEQELRASAGFKIQDDDETDEDDAQQSEGAGLSEQALKVARAYEAGPERLRSAIRRAVRLTQHIREPDQEPLEPKAGVPAEESDSRLRARRSQRR